MRKQEKIQIWSWFDNTLLPVGVPVSGSLTVMILASGCSKVAGKKKYSREKRRPVRNNNNEKNVTLNFESSIGSCLHLEGERMQMAAGAACCVLRAFLRRRQVPAAPGTFHRPPSRPALPAPLLFKKKSNTHTLLPWPQPCTSWLVRSP